MFGVRPVLSLHACCFRRLRCAVYSSQVPNYAYRCRAVGGQSQVCMDIRGEVGGVFH